MSIEAAFVEEEGPKIHAGLGGSSRYDTEAKKFEEPVPYKDLDTLLRAYVSNNLDIEVPEESWSTVYDKVLKIEEAEQEPDHSIRNIFSKLWIGVGRRWQAIEPWVDLIPNEYGLSLVKSAIVLVSVYAVRSAAKRQKLFDSLATIRDIIIEARFYRESFVTDSDVSQSATALYESIVKAVEELCQYLPASKPKDSTPNSHKWLGKLKGREKQPDPDVVLAKVIGKAKELRLCTERHANQTIDQTFRVVRNLELSVSSVESEVAKVGLQAQRSNQNLAIVGENVVEVHEDVRRMTKSTEHIETKIESLGTEVTLLRTDAKRALEQGLMHNSRVAKNYLVQLLEELKEEKKNDTAILAGEIKQLREQMQERDYIVSSGEIQRVITLSVAEQYNIEDLNSLLLHSKDDLISVISRQEQFDAASQGRAQSTLQETSFLHWLQSGQPDMLLLDANFPTSATSNISALSVFCAALTRNLVKFYPTDITTSFFCGCHTASSDPHYGPTGLIRSLLLQVLMALKLSERTTNISVDSHDRYIADLRHPTLEVLCDAFHRVCLSLPRGVTIICVVDAISCYDRDYQGLFDQLRVVLCALREVIMDVNMRAVCKVLLTNPGIATARLAGYFDSSEHVILSRNHSGSVAISDKLIETSISEIPA